MTDLDELDELYQAGNSRIWEIHPHDRTIIFTAPNTVITKIEWFPGNEGVRENTGSAIVALHNAYPALSAELRAARAVAEAGNALYQFGMRHDNDCGTRYDNGDCTCGLDKISHEFVQAWAEWQKARGEG